MTDLQALSDAATPGPWAWNSYSRIDSIPLCEAYNKAEALIPADAPEGDPRWDALPDTAAAYVPSIERGDLATKAGEANARYIVALVNWHRETLATAPVVPAGGLDAQALRDRVLELQDLVNDHMAGKRTDARWDALAAELRALAASPSPDTDRECVIEDHDHGRYSWSPCAFEFDGIDGPKCWTCGKPCGHVYAQPIDRPSPDTDAGLDVAGDEIARMAATMEGDDAEALAEAMLDTIEAAGLTVRSQDTATARIAALREIEDELLQHVNLVLTKERGQHTTARTVRSGESRRRWTCSRLRSLRSTPASPPRQGAAGMTWAGVAVMAVILIVGLIVIGAIVFWPVKDR